MQETKLFEELIKIDGNLIIDLEKDTSKEDNSKIKIFGKGTIDNDTLEVILSLAKKRGADVEISNAGFIEIKFLEDE
jgi:hypothetical protein